MDESSVLWRLGERWLDLLPRLNLAGSMTVVSLNGTATLLNLDEGWEQRVPLEGGHRLPGDGERHLLTAVLCATPCGLHIAGRGGRWHQTTRLLLVVEGLHPRWLETPLGQEAFRSVLRRRWEAPGHPPGACGARYCANGAARR